MKHKTSLFHTFLFLFLNVIAASLQAQTLSVQIKRLEGSGNMARSLDFKAGMHDSLFVSNADRIFHPIYNFNHGPFRIEILDQSLVPIGEMRLALDGVQPGSGWKMYVLGGTDTVYSASTIEVGDEQLIPQWGMLVQVTQVGFWEGDCDFILDCSVEQSADPWLTWLHDTDNLDHYSNWIRSGNLFDQNDPSTGDYPGDPEGCFETILDRTWAPYKMANHQDSVASPTWAKFKSLNHLENLHSVDIVITADQTKWTRCAVLEIADAHLPSIGDADRFNLRLSPSVNKNGVPDGSGTMGMSWFPGYAVSLETGERLNMAFGENSWFQADNGADMVWNPTATIETVDEEPVLGGGHYIYVFGHNGNSATDDVPFYDEGQFIFNRLSENNYQPSDPAKRRVFKDAMWVSIPLLVPGHSILESDVKLKLRVSRPYEDYQCLDALQNQTHPLYSFNIGQLGTAVQEQQTLQRELNIYPNPSSGLVTLSRTGKAAFALQLHNAMGQLVHTATGQQTSVLVDVSHLPEGIYLLTLEDESGRHQGRLLKH